MINNVLTLGAGSAGLLAAITLKKKLPHLAVAVVRSSDIGVIGVGEGTTASMPRHLFGLLKLPASRFYAQAEPTWKLGIRFLWGPRDHFNITFDHQLDGQWSNLPLPSGYYAAEDFHRTSIASALMDAGKAFRRSPSTGNGPDLGVPFGFHIENVKLVAALESIAVELGVIFHEGKVRGAERHANGITALLLDDGRRLEADFFVDSSGFVSELLGRNLAEPFISYDKALFCDRAVIGGWERTSEPILPFTTAETMEAGWAWQIEHEHHINRGYVYCSQAISDEAACEEFLRKNPRAPRSPRVVKFRSGRYRRMWVDNVVAIGNAAGFVEPLEATALMAVTTQSEQIVKLLEQSAMCPTPSLRDAYNRLATDYFDNIRDFLALHYKLNTRLDNPFWRHCQNDTDLGHLSTLLQFYRENGPTDFARHLIPSHSNSFGFEGYLVMLVGNCVEFQTRPPITPTERANWERIRSTLGEQAAGGFTVRQMLDLIRSPQWRWNT